MTDTIIFDPKHVSPLDTMKAKVVDLEKVLSGLMGREIEAFRQKHGDRLANELLMSTAALLAARSIGMVHVWTGEPVGHVRRRFEDTLFDDLDATVRKLFEGLKRKSGDS